MPSLSLTPALRADYNQLFASCVTRAGRESGVETIVDALVANEGRYRSVGTPLGIPWHFVAVIHNMEATRNFATHLHNGDPLTARTRQIPRNRPATGSPPFTWEESAADALTLEGLQRWTDWSVAGSLYKLEVYNGVGYRLHHPQVKSPYLWSFSNHYRSGKYISDGTWSDTAVSAQCGAAVLLRRMIERRLIGFDDEPLPDGNPAPMVVPYAPVRPSDPEVIAKAVALQRWLSTHPGIFLRPDGWPARDTSDAYKTVTGHYLPGDPRG
jgi:lysozyme family protein